MAKLIIKKRYGITPNDILNRNDISFKAKGLFGYLQSKPDGWRFSVERIKKQTSDGREAIRSGLKELEKHGYLQRIPIKGDSGKWDGYDYILTENPQELPEKFEDYPSSENPSTDNPSTEKLFTISKKDNSNKDNSNKDKRNDIYTAKHRFADEYDNISNTSPLPESQPDNLIREQRGDSRLDAPPNDGGESRRFTDEYGNILNEKIIPLFKHVNPSYKKLFANKTQRKALERLIKEHGVEKIVKVIKILPVTNVDPYAPTITTPVQLEDKLASLILFVKRQKNKRSLEEKKKSPIIK